MKKSFNYFLLAILAILSVAIIYLRIQGSIPSQIPSWLMVTIIVINSGWIFWNLRGPLLTEEQTRMERN
jgi:hypothetical protein